MMSSVTVVYNQLENRVGGPLMGPHIRPTFRLRPDRLRTVPDLRISTASQDLTRPSVTLIYENGDQEWEDTSLPCFSQEMLFLCGFIGANTRGRVSIELLHRGRNELPWLGEERNVRFAFKFLRNASLATYNITDGTAWFNGRMLDWLYCSLCADPVEERRKIRETILVTAAAIDYPQNQKTNHDWVFEKQIYTTILWVYRLINRYYVDCENSMQLEVAAAICKICIVLSAHGEFEFYNPENLFLRLIGAYGKIYWRWCLQAMDVATHLGKHYIDRGENKKALILYEESLEQYEKRCGKDGVISLRVADQIGVAYRNMGLYDKAFEYAKRAVEGYQKSLGKEDFETLMATNNMALAYMNLKRYDEALESNAIVVAGLKEHFRNCPSVITRAIRDTATIYQKSGNLGKRIECLRNHMAESCEIAGYGMGPETFESAFAMAHACIPEKIDTPAALEQFRLSFEMVKDAAYFYEENRNWFHFEKLEVMDTLITGWIYQGEIEKAMENQILNLAYRQQCLVADHLSIAQGHQQLGYLYTLSKRYPLALEEYRKALILYSQNVGPEHIYVLRTRFDTAVCYSLRNDFEKAIEEYSAVLVTMERVLGKEHNLCLVTTKNLKEMKSLYIPLF